MRILKSKNGVIRALKNNDRDFELSKELLYNDEFISELINEYTEESYLLFINYYGYTILRNRPEIEEKTITRILEILIKNGNTEILKDIFDILARKGKLIKYVEILKNLKLKLKTQIILHIYDNYNYNDEDIKLMKEQNIYINLPEIYINEHFSELYENYPIKCINLSKVDLEKYQDIIIKDLNLLGSYINKFIRICEDKTVLVEEIIKQNITEVINVKYLEPNDIIKLMKNKNNLYINDYLLYNSELHKNLFKIAIEYNYTYLFFNSEYGLRNNCLKDYKITLKENTINNLFNLKALENITNEYEEFDFIEQSVKTINNINSRIKYKKNDFKDDYIDNVEFLLSNFDFIER